MGREAVLSIGWLAFLLALAPLTVRAQPPSQLTYAAPASVCPLEETVRERLETLIRSVPAGELPAIDSTIQIAADGDAFVATIVMHEGSYEDRRSLRDADCAVLTEAAVFVVAVTLFPGLVRPAPTSTPAPSEADLDEVAEVAPATEPPELVPEVPAARVMLGSVWLAAHTSYGVLPGVAIGGELGGSIAFDPLRIDVALRGLPLVGARFGGSALLGGDIAQIVGLVRARGVGVPTANLELAAGGGIEAGAALGTGVGITDPRSASAPWVALEAAAGIAWVPSPYVALFLEIEALVPVVRPVFTVAGIGVLYRPESVGGALRLALELRIP